MKIYVAGHKGMVGSAIVRHLLAQSCEKPDQVYLAAVRVGGIHANNTYPAVQIAQQHQISFYGAHIVAAALASGASTLMTEDLHDGLVLGGLKIQNPFQ